MAASCVGVLGAFQYSAPRCDKQRSHNARDDKRHSTETGDDSAAAASATTNNNGDISRTATCSGKDGNDTLEEICPKCNDDLVWVIKRYEPTDLRFDAPVPRHKIVAKDPDEICRQRVPITDEFGQPCLQPTPRTWTRSDAEKDIFVSQPHTRCEQWSTLREMLPSRGRPDPAGPPNWGTGRATAPIMRGDRATRFPHINSEMTKFSDTAHSVDPLFRLH